MEETSALDELGAATPCEPLIKFKEILSPMFYLLPYNRFSGYSIILDHLFLQAAIDNSNKGNTL